MNLFNRLMLFKNKYLKLVLVAYGLSILFASRAIAQSVADTSLGSESTRILTDGLIDTVEGGARRRESLFHSFEDLQVNRGRSLYFQAEDISQIFSRVTGNKGSRIDGVIGTIGESDLYLINPNGIIFGADSRLDVNGSFLASTASSFVFQDYSYDSESPNDVPPLLTIRDWGLYLNSQRSIRFHGDGHTLTTLNNLSFNPFEGLGFQSIGHSVPEGESITLIGGNIVLDGAVITAPSGNINVFSIRSGNFLFENISELQNQAIELGNISIVNSSLIDVSGNGGSNIVVIGDQINLSGGSHIASENRGTLNGGVIIISSNSILIDGLGATEDLSNVTRQSSSIVSFNFFGKGSDINVNSNEISLINGGSINSITYGDADGGNISIDADEILIQGVSPLASQFIPSNFQAATLGDSRGGNLSIKASNLELLDSGVVSTTAFSIPPFEGQAGDLSIRSNNIYLDNPNIDQELFSTLSSPENNRIPSAIISSGSIQGNAGEVNITAHNIGLYSGGWISSNASSIGSIEGVNINAENIIVDGFLPGLDISDSPENRSEAILNSGRSQISSVFIPGSSASASPSEVIGASGDISINAENITVSDGGLIAAVNFSSGRGGNIFINSDSLVFDNGILSADLLTTGNGGNLVVETEDLFILGSSSISASSLGNLDGGNISLDSNSLVSLDSQISANANAGIGGNIEISTVSLLLSDSPVTATSALSSTFDGSVDINFLYGFEGIQPIFNEASLQNRSTLIQSCIDSFDGELYVGNRNYDDDSFSGSLNLWSPSSSELDLTRELDDEFEAASTLIEATTMLMSSNREIVFVAEPLINPMSTTKAC